MGLAGALGMPRTGLPTGEEDKHDYYVGTV